MIAVGATAWGAALAPIVGRQDWPRPEHADAVLVLGTSATVRGEPNHCMRVRVAEGVRLVQEGVAPVLVVSGALDPRDGVVEAEAMASIAIELGLSPGQILLERRATSTIENLRFGSRMVETEDATSRIVVVTEPFHMPRAIYAAGRLGIDATAAPSPRCEDRGPGWVLREPVALLWYRWKLR